MVATTLSHIYTIPSSFNKEDNKVVDTLNYPNWITFSRLNSDKHDHPRVISYINICLIAIYFSLQKDIFNYKDICCFLFFHNGFIFFMINVYSDDNQSALKYFKNTETNI